MSFPKRTNLTARRIGTERGRSVAARSFGPHESVGSTLALVHGASCICHLCTQRVEADRLAA
jgi:hypothetical protein